MATSTIKKSRVGRLLSSEIHRITEANQTYTVTENCWMSARISAEDYTKRAVVYINGCTAVLADVSDMATTIPVFKGDTIRTREYGNYYISFFAMGGVNARLLRDLLSGGLHDKQDKAGHIRQCRNICIKHWKEYNPVSIQKLCKLSYAVRGRSFFNRHNKCDNSQCRDIIEWQTRPYSNSKWRLQLYTRWSSLVAKPLHLWTRTINTALERGCVA